MKSSARIAVGSGRAGVAHMRAFGNPRDNADTLAERK
jgi:hypothetical protein